MATWFWFDSCSRLYVLRCADRILPENKAYPFVMGRNAFMNYRLSDQESNGTASRCFITRQMPRHTNDKSLSLFKVGVPCPPSSNIQQNEIVAEIEAEQALVNANRELIERFEKKIQAAIGRVWGGDIPVPSHVGEAE